MKTKKELIKELDKIRKEIAAMEKINHPASYNWLTAPEYLVPTDKFEKESKRRRKIYDKAKLKEQKLFDKLANL